MATIDSRKNVQAEVDPLHDALRVSFRPLEALGHYKWGVQNLSFGSIQGNALMASCQWTSPTNFAVITRVVFQCYVNAIPSAQLDPVTLQMFRGFTALDTTNVLQTVTFGGQQQACAPNMAPSLMTFQSSTTSGSNTPGMSGGTKIADANAIGAVPVGQRRDPKDLVRDLYKWDPLGAYPIVLSEFEGIGVQWGPTTTAFSGSGFKWAVLFEWAEVSTF
jgi:hypothetical protein